MGDPITIMQCSLMQSVVFVFVFVAISDLPNANATDPNLPPPGGGAECLCVQGKTCDEYDIRPSCVNAWDAMKEDEDEDEDEDEEARAKGARPCLG